MSCGGRAIAEPGLGKSPACALANRGAFSWPAPYLSQPLEEADLDTELGDPVNVEDETFVPFVITRVFGSVLNLTWWPMSRHIRTTYFA